MMMNKQVQKGGKESTNIQAENINVTNGITYTEAKSIALEVFHANFIDMSEKSASLAKKRAEEITEEFLTKLYEQNENGVHNAEDPDFQHSLFTVQKEYARTGDSELGSLLVDLLVDRTKHNKRTILQIVLNESLSVAPKLTFEQLSVLSVVFLLRYTINNNINDFNSLGNYLKEYVEPFSQSLIKNSSCYQHLEFSGCGSVSIGSSSLSSILLKYQGLFIKGFNINELKKIK